MLSHILGRAREQQGDKNLMAYVTHPTRALESSWLGQRLVNRWPEIGERLARYRQYRTTVDELSHLSDRELADFGMDRGNIHAIAREHVYGR
jgi:uncharacterized protein YjiS (DUF1127 family)